VNIKRVRGAVSAAASAFLIVALLPSTALAGNADYVPAYKVQWKPTGGSINLRVHSQDWWKHFVSESFTWGTTVSVARIDAPRTPAGHGNYEHELRFFPDGGSGWCADSTGGPYNIFLDLPPDHYRDLNHAVNEYTWGMRTYGVDTGHTYDIDFQCDAYVVAGKAGVVRDFNLTAQIGHCHTPCVQQNVWPDDTLKLIPNIQYNAPIDEGVSRTFNWDDTFDDNRSFETAPGSWGTPNGTEAWNCGGGATHGSCFVRVIPNNSSIRVKYQRRWDPGSPNALATASSYEEFVVRCPTLNDTDCTFRFSVEVFNAQDQLIEATRSVWWVISQGNSTWWYMPATINSTGSGSSSAYWKFVVEGGPGDTIDLDYHHISWYRPA
jgi:hypothetical protein